MDRLRREPVTVEIPHPRTGKPVQVKIAWNVVGGRRPLGALPPDTAPGCR